MGHNDNTFTQPLICNLFNTRRNTAFKSITGLTAGNWHIPHILVEAVHDLEVTFPQLFAVISLKFTQMPLTESADRFRNDPQRLPDDLSRFK